MNRSSVYFVLGALAMLIIADWGERHACEKFNRLELLFTGDYIECEVVKALEEQSDGGR